ncbi:MAG TPA: hypothetical protein VMD03_08660 [Steroidobacteraceae bacterium]|nr:hypothetical protein [Steroidobacteraceae bacterium]
MLATIAEQASRERYWRTWLGSRLPGPVCDRITGIIEASGELVIFTQSAGWGVRARYAMSELDAELRGAHPGIGSVSVRVLPKATPA